MTIDDPIKDEKLQYDINREAAKLSALSSSKLDIYKHLIGKEIFPSDQKQIIEQAKFTYSSLDKTFEKQNEKQLDATRSLKPCFDKTNEFKQIENIYPQKIGNKIINNWLKEILIYKTVLS